MWTIVWLFSGVQLHTGSRRHTVPAVAAASAAAAASSVPARASPAEKRAPGGAFLKALPPTARPVTLSPSNSLKMPAEVPHTAGPADKGQDARVAMDAPLISRGSPGTAAPTRPPVVAGAVTAETLVETPVDVLLARSRGPYKRAFEAFVQGERVKELMHDPYSYALAEGSKEVKAAEARVWEQVGSKEEQRQLLGSGSASAEASEGEAAGKSGETWDWFSGAFSGQGGKEDSTPPGHDHKKAKVPLLARKKSDSAELACEFEADLDYLGKDVGTVEGLSDQECCELCARKTCDVAVMSSDYDEPPRACWLKTKVRKRVSKRGVRACWPPNHKKDWMDSRSSDR